MSEKAFTITSTHYCGVCGSFDLINTHPSWLGKTLLGASQKVYCFGCGHQFSQQDYRNNAIRTVPVTVDDFFFQTNLRNQQIRQRHAKPITQWLGLAIIASALMGLLVYQVPNEFERQSPVFIRWSALTESDQSRSEEEDSELLQTLQLELNNLVETQ